MAVKVRVLFLEKPHDWVEVKVKHIIEESKAKLVREIDVLESLYELEDINKAINFASDLFGEENNYDIDDVEIEHSKFNSLRGVIQDVSVRWGVGEGSNSPHNDLGAHAIFLIKELIEHNIVSLE